MKRRKDLVVVLAVVACVCFLGVAAVFAVQKKMTLRQFEKAFSIDTMDETEFHFYSKRRGFVRPFITCLAAVRESPLVCSHLGEEDAQLCRRNYEVLHQLYRGLILENAVTDSLIALFIKQDPGNSPQAARDYLRGFLDKDGSPCGKNKECLAYLNRDTARCPGGPDRYCVDSVRYFKAITSRRASDCRSIKDESIKNLCLVGVGGDMKVCEASASFKKFIREYYNDYLKRFSPKTEDSQ